MDDLSNYGKWKVRCRTEFHSQHPAVRANGNDYQAEVQYVQLTEVRPATARMGLASIYFIRMLTIH